MDYRIKRSGSSKSFGLGVSTSTKNRVGDLLVSPGSSKNLESKSKNYQFSEIKSTIQGNLTCNSNPKKLKSFFQFLANCDNLQKDVNEASTVIEQSIVSSKKEIDLDRYLKKEIRNKEYKEGLKKIEERIKVRKEKNTPKEIKSLKTMVTKNTLTSIDHSICHEDVTSKQAVDFLGENKRNFGDDFSILNDTSQKPRFKRKHSDIKINPQETVIEEFYYESAIIKPKTHRNSLSIKAIDPNPAPVKSNPSLGTKAKLPSLSLASILVARAKADANRLFSDRKIINNRIKNRKKSGLL